MKISYQEKNLSSGTLETISVANDIISEYSAQGYDLTLRQLYYQFVARGLIKNKQSEYKRLGGIISDGRLNGLISWSAIVDRTRGLSGRAYWDSPSDIIEACARQFQVDPWETQPAYVEVWIEKEALAGVFEKACRDLHVPFFSCRGYVSLSSMWSAAMRLRRRANTHGKKCIILHFGDHDPSGIDMTRDIEDRLDMFGATVDLRRLALNMDQIEEFDPPPNPAKLTDSRASSYVMEHGYESWELDALPPNILSGLVEREVRKVIDSAAWDERLGITAEGRKSIQWAANNWETVNDMANEEPDDDEDEYDDED